MNHLRDCFPSAVNIHARHSQYIHKICFVINKNKKRRQNNFFIFKEHLTKQIAKTVKTKFPSFKTRLEINSSLQLIYKIQQSRRA